jgi:hypothetical protein
VIKRYGLHLDLAHCRSHQRTDESEEKQQDDTSESSDE